jgi:hypothetical protein
MVVLLGVFITYAISASTRTTYLAKYFHCPIMSNSLSLAFLAQDVLITVMSYLGIGDVLRIRSVSEHVYVLILLFLSQASDMQILVRSNKR